MQNNSETPLSQIAAVDLTGCTSVADMAARESVEPDNWNPDDYAMLLSEHIRDSGVPLDRQRERLAALAQVGQVLQGDAPAAAELARHALILTALFERFALVAHNLSGGKSAGLASAAVERYLNAALKSQRAALGTLSALKTLRNSATAPTTTGGIAAPAPTTPTTPETLAAPQNVAVQQT